MAEDVRKSLDEQLTSGVPMASPAPHINGHAEPATRSNGSLHDDEREPASSIDNSGDEWSGQPSSVSDEEDYDTMKLDTDAVISGSKGAGVEHKAELKIDTLEGTPMSPKGRNGDARKSFEIRRTSMSEDVVVKPELMRRKSIHVVLEKTAKKGRYVLTAEEPEIRDILLHTIEQEGTVDPKKRKRFRDLVFTRQFTTFDRQNPLSADSPFHGFFTLFWLCIAMLLVRVAMHNWRDYGSILGRAEILHMMTERDLIVLGITDGVMCVGTMVGLGLQKLILKEYISWNRSGWIIQNLWQSFYLGAILWWTYWRDWPWTHTVFTVLHGIVFLMKQHSYAFYNGYLSQVYRRKRIVETKLRQLSEMSPLASPVSPKPPVSFSTALEDRPSSPNETTPTRRRGTSNPSPASTNLSKEKSEVSSIATAIESGSPLDPDQMAAFNRVLRSERQRLSEELDGKCTSTDNAYPSNLTVGNWADWVCLPTLVYELEYPRQEHISWSYVAEKTVACLGTIWVMIIVSQAYMYPLVLKTLEMKRDGLSLQQRWEEFPWICMDLLFPMLLEQLLTWYVIWECVLNVLAELTRFADRGFYGDWWNSVSWDQYARDWNRPVHNFLLRHVYHSSISAFHLSKGTATFATFLLSALVHELVMWCVFKKVRGYLFCMQLMQLPLAAMSRTKLLKGRKLLGNVVFWIGLFVGPSLITSLYLIV